MSWATFIPLALRLIDWLLGKAKASNETRNKMQELMKAIENDGLITVQAKDEFQKQMDELNKGE